MKVVIKSEGLASVLGVEVDDTVDVKCKNGVPVVQEWRNRFRDMKQDNCIELVEQKKTSFSKKPTVKEADDGSK